MMNNNGLLIAYFMLAACSLKAQGQRDSVYHEQFRPQVHFSPKEHWMNDPNGMVYYKGVYHLFFQYFPGGTTWGPMHWGHTVSKDLVHWKELPIALYPDSLGFIFSGSAVADINNTSGFGKDGKIPLVAIFTHHDSKSERAGKDNFQNESLAYSLDDGNTWTKYDGNPVLKNPGIRDFRDPSVIWFEPQKKWVMTLATKDRVTFYSSPNLKDWKKESDFGSTLGAHTGVWECPNLFPLKFENKIYWVLIGSVNPGGPNGGSATQYFIGHFDGTTFTPESNAKTKWIDYGPDDYAGVTWANTGSRKIFLGWMSNWTYAGQLPTVKWRNAMTIPRDLAVKRENNELYITSNPVKEFKAIDLKPIKISSGGKDDFSYDGIIPDQYELNLSFDQTNGCTISLSNDEGDKLEVGFNKATNSYYVDRNKSGLTAFNPEFPKILFAPRLTNAVSSKVTLLFDSSSLELFGDDGLSVLSALFFPRTPFNHLQFHFAKNNKIKNLELVALKSIW